MHPDDALKALLAVHAERIQLIVRRQLEGKEWSDENAIGLLVQWGWIGWHQHAGDMLPSDCDEVLFLRAIVRVEGDLFPVYIPVRYIDHEAEVFTDDQLCRKKPD